MDIFIPTMAIIYSCIFIISLFAMCSGDSEVFVIGLIVATLAICGLTLIFNMLELMIERGENNELISQCEQTLPRDVKCKLVAVVSRDGEE